MERDNSQRAKTSAFFESKKSTQIKLFLRRALAMLLTLMFMLSTVAMAVPVLAGYEGDADDYFGDVASPELGDEEQGVDVEEEALPDDEVEEEEAYVEEAYEEVEKTARADTLAAATNILVGSAAELTNALNQQGNLHITFTNSFRFDNRIEIRGRTVNFVLNGHIFTLTNGLALYDSANVYTDAAHGGTISIEGFLGGLYLRDGSTATIVGSISGRLTLTATNSSATVYGDLIVAYSGGIAVRATNSIVTVRGDVTASPSITEPHSNMVSAPVTATAGSIVKIHGDVHRGSVNTLGADVKIHGDVYSASQISGGFSAVSSRGDSTVTISGNVTQVCVGSVGGVDAGDSAKITVGGNVRSNWIPIRATGTSKVTVYGSAITSAQTQRTDIGAVVTHNEPVVKISGNVFADIANGVIINGGSVVIMGDVTTLGVMSTGVLAQNGGSATIYGSLFSAGNHIEIQHNSNSVKRSLGEHDRVENGFYVFTDNSNTVRVLARPVTGVRLDKNSAEMLVGDTVTLTATITPLNATNQYVTWKSDNPSVVTVTNGIVTAISPGTAVITTTTVDGGYIAQCTINVFPLIIVTQSHLPSGAMNYSYNATILATGLAPMRWSVEGGELPQGLYLIDNAITGVPIKAGEFSFTVKAQNDWGYVTREFVIVIYYTPLSPTIKTAILSEGTIGVPYTANIDASGTAPISWAVDSGNLPNGLLLSDDGVISGTPEEIGVFDFTVRASNMAGYCTKSLYIDIISDITEVILDRKFTVLQIGDSETLTATVAPLTVFDNTVVWSSDNETVATVDSDGNITAVALGEARITATTLIGGHMAYSDIYVSQSVTGVTLDVDSLEFNLWAMTANVPNRTDWPNRTRTMNITATTAPLDATDTEVQWESSNPSVVSVTQLPALWNQNRNVSRARIDVQQSTGIGTAEITVTASDGEHTASLIITVYGENVWRVRNSSELSTALTLPTWNPPTNRYVILENDISARNWNPVNNFQGTLNGRGHTINNFSVTRQSMAGLFGTLNSGNVTIKNLGINIGSDGISAIHFAGGLVANVSGANVTVENSFVNGSRIRAESILNSTHNNRAISGGFIGQMGANSSVTIRNSYACTRVEARSGRGSVGIYTFNARAYAGGLVGYRSGGTLSIENSYSSSTVSAETWHAYQFSVDFAISWLGLFTSGETWAGGLVGRGSPTIVRNSFIAGMVSATGGTRNINHRYGVLLMDSEFIDQSTFPRRSNWAFGTVWNYQSGINRNFPVLTAFQVNNEVRIRTAQDLRNRLVGGVASENRTFILENDINVLGWTPVNDFRGTFDGQGHTITISSNVGGNNQSAGLFGEIRTGNVTIRNLGVRTTATGRISASSMLRNTVRMYAGGIVGRIAGNASVTIQNSFFDGNVYVRSMNNSLTILDVVKPLSAIAGLIKNVSQAFSHSGGLVGYMGNQTTVTISNSFARGTVYAWASTSNIYAKILAHAHAGGLVGRNNGGNLRIANSYAINSVETESTGLLNQRRLYAGGLLGSGEASVTNSYRLSTQTVIGRRISYVGQPLLLGAMQNQSSFVGWDFNNIWGITSSKNDGIPHLAHRTRQIPQPTHSVVNNFSGIQGAGESLDVMIDVPHTSLSNIFVNDNRLTENLHFSVKPGSTLVSLFDSFIYTLDAGTHTLRADFWNGISLSKQFAIIGDSTGGYISGAAEIGSISINGVQLNRYEHFTVEVEQGIKRIIFKDSFISALPLGTHLLTMVLADGSTINDPFTIDSETPPNNQQPPATDNNDQGGQQPPPTNRPPATDDWQPPYNQQPPQAESPAHTQGTAQHRPRQTTSGVETPGEEEQSAEQQAQQYDDEQDDTIRTIPDTVEPSAPNYMQPDAALPPVFVDPYTPVTEDVNRPLFAWIIGGISAAAAVGGLAIILLRRKNR